MFPRDVPTRNVPPAKAAHKSNKVTIIAKVINPPGQGHLSCLFPRALLPLLQWKMPFFHPHPKCFYILCLCPAGSPPFCKRRSINQRLQKLRRGFWHRVPHTILTQQETALGITGNVILEEEERVNVGKHCGVCTTRRFRQAPIPRFPWLQARHLGCVLDEAAGSVMVPHIQLSSSAPDCLGCLQVGRTVQTWAVISAHSEHHDWHESAIAISSKFITALPQCCGFFLSCLSPQRQVMLEQSSFHLVFIFILSEKLKALQAKK